MNDRYITEKSTIDGRPTCAPAHWDENMKIYFLTEKMRCNKDQYFNTICDRVGEGKIEPQDEKFFQSRIIETDLENDNNLFKEGKLSIVVSEN